MNENLLETFLQAYKCNNQQRHQQLIVVVHYFLFQQKYLVVNNGKVKRKALFLSRTIRTVYDRIQ